MKLRIVFGLMFCSFVLGSTVVAQRTVKRHTRASPPNFQPNEFSGVFFSDAIGQLQGEMPDTQSLLAGNKSPSTVGAKEDQADMPSETANGIWKNLINGATVEDLVKESATRLDGMLTTPAKFAGGGVVETRREFTLLATTMAVIDQYPEEIRWKPSAAFAQRIFARVAANCKVGTQPVFNEAKQRQVDLQTMLKGVKISGNAEEVSWADTADRGPTMQIMEWALREHLAPSTSSEAKFNDSQEEIMKYAELLAVFGQVIQQPGMTDADDKQYMEYAIAMTKAAQEVSKAVRSKDADLARTAVGRVDQACSKCHETYR
jgi:hypothetical protein